MGKQHNLLFGMPDIVVKTFRTEGVEYMFNTFPADDVLVYFHEDFLHTSQFDVVKNIHFTAFYTLHYRIDTD